MLREHAPIIIETFNGLWKRGDPESCPIDHSPNCVNVKFDHSAVQTRDGLNLYRAIGNPLRIFKFTQQNDNGQSILILNDQGELFHCPDENTVYGPILSIPLMSDFNMTAIAGRAYITPFTTYFDPITNQAIEKGIEGEWLYVYKGDGTDARKAAGFPPTNSSVTPFIAFNNGQEGIIDKGVHLVAVSFSDGAGARSIALGTEVSPVIQAPGQQEIQVNNIPLGGVGVNERIIYMTHAIPTNEYDPAGVYIFYEAKVIPDNTTRNIAVSINDVGLTVPFVSGLLPTPSDGGALRISNTSIEGDTDFGLRVIGVVYETNTGYLTAPGPEFFAVQSSINLKTAITISNIPVSPDSFVTKRHLVSTKVLPEYNGDQVGFQFFFIPDGTIDDNVTTSLTVSFYDDELLDDASHLIDNFAEIAAGVGLTTYHGRLILNTQFEDISLIRVSEPGEPEAINQVDGLVIIPLDGNPLTVCQELRDILYACKTVRTAAVTDNGDVPSSWSVVTLEQGIGAPVHGIASVLDSGGVDIDYLIMASVTGIMLFNGSYSFPELSWKIEDYWNVLTKNDFRFIQVMNDTIGKLIWISLPNRDLLMGDYRNGLDVRNIRWTPVTFDVQVTTIALIERNRLLIGVLSETV